MKKAQLMGFMELIIGLILLVGTVTVSYEAVTGLKMGALLAGETSQDITSKIDSAMMAPEVVSIIAPCPNGYEVEIENSRVSVRFNKLFEDETVDAYFLLPKGTDLPDRVFVKCDKTNFFRIEKWRDKEGKTHLRIKDTADFEYSEIDWENVAQNVVEDPSIAPMDSDGDGLKDWYEEELGTDPDNPDTDGDGLNDKEDPDPLVRT